MTACILLAGGLGTRLRGAVPGVPKCLAPVAGIPFLEIQMERMASQGIERFILSLGYLADQVIEVAKKLSKRFRVEWVVEPRPLGTGGATLLAMHHAALSEALVANADTFVEADLSPLLSPLDSSGGEQIRMMVVHSINAGIYRIHRNAFARYRPGQSFSLEADVAEALAKQGKLAAAAVTGTFIDIGVPEDYFRFCAQFSRPLGSLAPLAR